MKMHGFAVLMEMAPRFGEADFETKEGDDTPTCTLTFTGDETGAILAAIASIEDEVRMAHDRTTASEMGVLDTFVAAGLASGKDPADAFRSAMVTMKTRSDVLDKRVNRKPEEDSAEE